MAQQKPANIPAIKEQINQRFWRYGIFDELKSIIKILSDYERWHRAAANLLTASVRALSEKDVNQSLQFAEQLIRKVPDKRVICALITYHSRTGNHPRALRYLELLDDDDQWTFPVQSTLAASNEIEVGSDCLSRQLDALEDKSAKRYRTLSRELKRIDRTVYRQVASYLDLRAIVGFNGPIPPLRGYAISPDLAVHLTFWLDYLKPSQVLELGSGFSSVILARYCASNNTTLISLEHEAYYAEQTRELLDAWGLASCATVVDCPLKVYSQQGHDIPFYDSEPLRECGKRFDFVFVDGPPMSVDPRVRGGLIPLFGDFLAPSCRILLDDYCRDEEKQVVVDWEERGYVRLIAAYEELEKQAAHLQFIGV